MTRRKVKDGISALRQCLRNYYATYDPEENARKSYDLAISSMREKLESFRCERIGPHKLYLGDCREVLPLLGTGFAVVTDPPYGISADKKNAHSSIRDNAAWDSFGWDEHRPDDSLIRMLAKYPEVAIWGGNYFADLLPASSGWLVWRKPQAETGFSLADVELCWTNKIFAARTKSLPRRDGNAHPTQKPLEVMLWTLGFIEGASVIDPFMGSGTTGVACVRLGRRFVGVEAQPAYFDTAVRRIEEATKQSDLFVEPPKPEEAEQLSLMEATDGAA